MRQIKITKSITNIQDASLSIYLANIRGEEILSFDEESRLAQKIHNGDQQALDRLVRANLRFVISIAKQYQNNHVPLSDLIQEGNLGLVVAAHRYDETRGFKFISFAVWYIRKYMIEAIMNDSNIVRKPQYQTALNRRIRMACDRYEMKNSYLPSIDEISEELYTFEYRVSDNIKHFGEVVSMDSQSIKDRENIMCGVTIDGIRVSGDVISDDFHLSDGVFNTLSDILIDKNSVVPDDRLLCESLKFDLDRYLNITLDERESDIIKLFYGFGCKAMDLDEIAVKYRLTRLRIVQIKAKALRKLYINPKKKNLRKLF